MIPMYRSNAGNNVITPASRRLLCRDDMWIGREPNVVDDASAFVLKRMKFVKFIGILSMINGTGPGAKVKTTPVLITAPIGWIYRKGEDIKANRPFF